MSTAQTNSSVTVTNTIKPEVKKVGTPIKPPSDKFRSTAKIPTIDGILKAANEKEKEAPKTVDDDEQFGAEPYTQEDFLKAWERYEQQTKSAGRESEYAVLKQEKRLEDNHRIIITFTNSLKEEILKSFRAELVTHLKKTLNNRHITLETELKEMSTNKVPYTNSERFDFMSEQQPILKDLKDRLGLDPDF